MPAPNASDLSSIMLAGVQAPSADNHHCFEFRVAQEGILLYGSATYLTAPYHKRILSLISFGAVVENMTIRAARLGYRAHASWLPDAGQPALIARIHLTEGEATETPLDQAISNRRTNRKLYFSGPRLSQLELTQLRRLLHGIAGVTLAFFDSGQQRAALLRLIRVAEAERFNVRALHEDLFSAIRFDAGWHSTAAEGLPPAVLGVEPGARWAFAQLRHWPLMNALRHFGIHHALGFRAGYLPCRLAPHLGVLTTSLPVERGSISVGMALERLWLQTESRGLALQPFAGSALLALPGYSEVPTETGARLRRGWKALTDETPLMVFRVGNAERPAFRTSRQALESYVRAEP